MTSAHGGTVTPLVELVCRARTSVVVRRSSRRAAAGALLDRGLGPHIIPLNPRGSDRRMRTEKTLPRATASCLRNVPRDVWNHESRRGRRDLRERGMGLLFAPECG